MLHRVTLPILLLPIIIVASNCRRSQPSPARYIGKYVVSDGCGQSVVKFLSGPITDSSVLVKSWTDTAYHNGMVADTTFTNVFAVKNWMTFRRANLKLGDVFTFALNQHDPNTDTLYMCPLRNFAMPAVANTVTDIQPVPQ